MPTSAAQHGTKLEKEKDFPIEETYVTVYDCDEVPHTILIKWYFNFMSDIEATIVSINEADLDFLRSVGDFNDMEDQIFENLNLNEYMKKYNE